MLRRANAALMLWLVAFTLSCGNSDSSDPRERVVEHFLNERVAGRDGMSFVLPSIRATIDSNIGDPLFYSAIDSFRVIRVDSPFVFTEIFARFHTLVKFNVVDTAGELYIKPMERHKRYWASWGSPIVLPMPEFDTTKYPRAESRIVARFLNEYKLPNAGNGFRYLSPAVLHAKEIDSDRFEVTSLLYDSFAIVRSIPPFVVARVIDKEVGRVKEMTFQVTKEAGQYYILPSVVDRRYGYIDPWISPPETIERGDITKILDADDETKRKLRDWNRTRDTARREAMPLSVE